MKIPPSALIVAARRSAKDLRMRLASRARLPAPPDNRPADAIRSPANADSRLGKPIGSLVSAADSPVNVDCNLQTTIATLPTPFTALQTPFADS
jgi:hypothetical protein